MRTFAPLAFAAAMAVALSANAADYHAPKNGFGQPDLGGAWTNASLTSLQRPAMFKSLTLTDAEAAAMEKRRAAARRQRPGRLQRLLDRPGRLAGPHQWPGAHLVDR
jgi:Spy/CpxP family protein refolding chaperone